MSQTQEFIDKIYSRIENKEYYSLDSLITDCFSSWRKYKKWSEFDTVFFAIDLNKINKKAALLLLQESYEVRNEIAFYKFFWGAAVDKFGKSIEFTEWKSK